ncbi:hypothetical protein CEP52_014541 [Fusarium oligoseptatum]|uniref:Uncharacterized protein n=1 Tax=Fusarium oligoseptatum TaxID=2604345 RepID=A0A428SLB0_9HYPO|nr:hypothetical protein CEP52_014541 [Fusarium oligoseptatum]
MGRFCRGRNGVQHQLNIVCLCPVRRLVVSDKGGTADSNLFLLNHDAERLKSPGTMRDSPPLVARSGGSVTVVGPRAEGRLAGLTHNAM